MQSLDAIAFDLYGTLFDVHSVAARCDAAFPGRGDELSARWRQKQLEYTWLRSLMDRYVDFHEATRDALRYTCRHLGLPLDDALRESLCDAYLQLRPFPEVPAALHALRERGVRLAILSNGSPASIEAVVSHAGLRDAFDHLLSVDAVQVFKPHGRAYTLAEQAFDLPRERILFVSSNAWDATGAKYFGFPTCWIDRAGAPFEEMGQRPDWQVASLRGVVDLFEAR